jgi:transcriptional regulator with XRE-family HTH domain
MDMDDKEADPEIREYVKKIARKIREKRQKARLSQMELSFKAGLSQNHIYAIEAGHRLPNMYTVLKICKALAINPAELFTYPDEDRITDRETILRILSKYI